MEAFEARRYFMTLVQRAPGDFRLAEGALCIAQEEYPDLHVEDYLHRLDAMAAVITSRLGLELEPRRIVTYINTYLFDEQGFRGNLDNYYDPRNSFLNDVLDRKIGIPITLSVLYLDIARKVGLPVVGTGLPGHFIVQYQAQTGVFWIDPFHGGRVLTRDDCITRMTQIYGPSLPWSDAYLQEVSDHAILTRMLNNLKAIYVERHDYQRALGAVERLMLLLPEAPTEVRDRGLLHARLGHFAAALDDLQHYRQLVPAAPDAAIIQRHITALQQRLHP